MTPTRSSFLSLSKPLNEIDEEFAKIPNSYLRDEPTEQFFPEFSDALHFSNTLKNRYANILPYNANRVQLENRSPNYINASHCLSNTAILCQGPLEEGENGYPDHHADFYHMIWTCNSSAIAMLTGYQEKGWIKCSYYLPVLANLPNATENLDLRPSQSPGIGRSNLAPVSNSGDDSIAPIAGAFPSVLNQIFSRVEYSKSAGEYTITTVFEKRNEDDLLREKGIHITRLMITNVAGEQRCLNHYHLPTWLDSQGTSAKTVAAFAKILLKERNPVIHCSAGIGRSGTLAAVMKAYQQILNGTNSNTLIPDVVASLRLERRGCVQTADQYRTVYSALSALVQEEENSL